MQHTVWDETPCSVLGFGCGSVLGRVGRRASLRAMNAAWNNGINLFDTARSYGFGEAEAVLGEFLLGKRQQAVLATKYGLPPQPQSTVKRLALPAVRAAMRAPIVRSALKRGGPSHQRTAGEFSVQGLRTSVEESLRQLRTDYLDLLFLHEASADVLGRDDLMLALEGLRSAGKVLRVGLYSDAAVVAQALYAAPPVLTAMQYGADPFDPVVASFKDSNPRSHFFIGNHPFGSADRVSRVTSVLAAMANDQTVPLELREKLQSSDWPMLNEAVFGMALSGSLALVLSMMQTAHITANARAVDHCRFTPTELTIMRNRMLVAAQVLA